jgi:hypothetical protein
LLVPLTASWNPAITYSRFLPPNSALPPGCRHLAPLSQRIFFSSYALLPRSGIFVTSTPFIHWVLTGRFVLYAVVAEGLPTCHAISYADAGVLGYSFSPSNTPALPSTSRETLPPLAPYYCAAAYAFCSFLRQHAGCHRAVSYLHYRA